MKRLLIALIAFTFSASVLADVESRDVPEKLFGITLGGVYDLGDPEKKDFGDIPVKKTTGTMSFLGNGIHYYFQPKEAHTFFSYVEKRKKPSDKYFKTSFRLYLLPVIPPTITTTKQLNEAKVKWEVTLIEWSNKAKTKEDAYFWASDLCKTFGVDISVVPEIRNDFDSKDFTCTFTSGDRQFEVSSFIEKTVRLRFGPEVNKQKQDAVDKIIRKLQANEIRPY